MKSIFSLFVFSIVASSALADPAISRVCVHQRWPWSAKVDVTYDLSGTAVPVDVAVTATVGGETVQIEGKALEGEYLSVMSGTHTLTWDPAVSLPELGAKKLDGVAFTLKPVMEKRYMIVDLSDGLADTREARVSYTNEVVGTGVDAAGGRAWGDEYKTTKLVLRRCPAGTFRMGSPASELYRQSNETLRQVAISRPFYIGVFEFTFEQCRRIGHTPTYSYFTNAAYRATRPVDACLYTHVVGDADYPSCGAVSAIGRLRSKSGVAFHLPTEAQWEYACRAGTIGVTYAVNEEITDYAQTQGAIVGVGNSNRATYYTAKTAVSPEEGGTKAVGLYVPNAWGLYDTIGNVAEWTRDWYATTGYGDGKKYLVDPSPTAEQAVQNWAGTGAKARVCRGVGYANNSTDVAYYNFMYCRAAARRGGRTNTWDVHCTGFRVWAPAD